MPSQVFIYIIPFLISFGLALIFTPLVKKLALKLKIIDYPEGSRKLHHQPVPLLGGLALFFSFFITLLLSWSLGWLHDGIIAERQILGLILGGLILIVGGALDDKYHLSPWQSFLAPLLAVIIVISLGISVSYITNPLFTGTGPYGRALFYFDWVNLDLISFGALFSFLWLLIMIYATKFLDGLDGLVTGIGFIGAIILFIVSLFWDVPLSGTSILCLIFAGALLGFLPYNFYPARIFLGEGGATFIGFILGTLAIISGGKIATALLIMGLPILDVGWVVLRRLSSGRHIYHGDREHLHFRLLDLGLSQRKVVLLLYLLTLIFGSSSLFLQSQHKVIALIILFIVMIALISAIFLLYNKKRSKT